VSDSRDTREPSLSWDIFCDVTGRKWTAIIYKHSPPDFDGEKVWQRSNMRTSHNAEVAAEAAHQRLIKKLGAGVRNG